MRYLYIISDNPNRTKIGIARNPNRRIKALQTGNPNLLKIYYQYSIPYYNCQNVETILHYILGRYRIKGEWFNITPEEAKTEVELLLMRIDLNDDLKPYLQGGYKSLRIL